MTRSIPLLALLPLALLGCVSALDAPGLTACTPPGLERAAVCGTVAVPENRTRGDGRTIDLNVVVIPAASAQPEPDPLVLLAGGPGQGAAEMAALVAPSLEPLLTNRDLVLIDQRGTGRSSPLHCAGGFDLLEPSRAAHLRRCAEELQKGADLTQYTTDAAVQDLDDVLDRLGHSKVNLVAVSYGTRVAFVLMRRHPERVRTAVLRAVAPIGFNIITDGSTNFGGQLEQLIADCRTDDACGRAYPRFAEQLAAVRERVERKPVLLSEDLELTPSLLQQTLYALLLSATTRQMIPFFIASAAEGDFAPLTPVVEQIRSALYGGIPLGMYLSVVCSEDAPRVTTADRAAMPDTFRAFGDALVDACLVWPRGTVAGELQSVRPIGTPTLIVSGAADPAMPASTGEDATSQLTRSLHIVAPATAHGPMFPGCIADAVRQFIESGGAAAIDTSCVDELQWPPFRMPAAQPAVR